MSGETPATLRARAEQLAAQASVAEQRAEAIYERSVAEALGGCPEQLDSDGDGTLWLLCATRGEARAYYADEFGVKFTQVRVTREWMAPDLDAIRDTAEFLATEDPDDVGEEPVAYTWECDGFTWSHASKDAPGAVLFWRCEEAPDAVE